MDDNIDILKKTFSKQWLTAWKQRGMERLQPIQERAIREMGWDRTGNRCGDDENLLVVAPTSAGKTFVAEVAMGLTMNRRRKAVYLVPTRALAEQKYQEFQSWLEPLGLRVVCATRDRPETDERIFNEQYDCCVAVYEKMSHYLLARPELVANIGVVAIDEIQMLGDPERGGPLDLLVTRLIQSPYDVQLIGMTAGIDTEGEESTAAALGAWLDGKVIIDNRRPVPLREGVLDFEAGRFRYQVGGEEPASENFADPDELRDHFQRASEFLADLAGPEDIHAAGLLAVAADLLIRGEQCLVFAPTRRASRLWARALAAVYESGTASAGPARQTLGHLMGRSPENSIDRTTELLAPCLERGIAFHNADLDDDARQSVEAGLNEGEIRAVVCTPTLGAGVNLAGANVLHYPWCIGRGGTLQPLQKARFSNYGGRAARLGIGASFGRSIIVAMRPGESERFWQGLISGPIEPTQASLNSMSPGRVALELLAGGITRNTENLQGYLDHTFAGQGGGCEGVRKALGRWLASESAAPFLASRSTANQESTWQLSELGETVATLGIEPESALMIAQLVETHVGLFDLLKTLAETPDGEYLSQGLGTRAGHCSDLDLADQLNKQAKRSGGFSRSERRAIRTALILVDWLAGMPTAELESNHNVLAGRIKRLGEDFSWLFQSAASIAALLNAPDSQVHWYRSLALRSKAGLPDKALELAPLADRRISRHTLLRLADEGLDSDQAILAADNAQLSDLTTCDEATILVEKATLNKKEPPGRELIRGAPPQTHASPPAAVSELTTPPAPLVPVPHSALPSPVPALLELDSRRRGIVYARGEEVRLPPLSFDLLTALASHPGEVLERTQLYFTLWPDGGPEEQQLDNHRRMMLQRLRPKLGAETDRIAEVVRGIGFRFSHAPDQIRVHGLERGG